MHLLMLVATVCWAANMVAIKAALRGLNSLALVQVRVLGAASLFALGFAAWRGRPSLKLGARGWAGMLVLALSGVAFNQLFFIGGLARTSVAHTGLLVALGPVLVLVLACLMHLEALTAPKLAGMLVSFLGVAILTTGRVGQGNGSYWRGDFIVLAASAVFALYTIQAKRVADRCDAVTLNAVTYAMGAVLLLPFAGRAFLATPWRALGPSVVWAVAYVIVLGSVVPYALYAFALSDLSASRVAAFSYLQPVIATSLALWLLAEKLTWSIVTGGVLILLGVFLTEHERDEESGR